jgi:hypothetical protein
MMMMMMKWRGRADEKTSIETCCYGSYNDIIPIHQRTVRIESWIGTSIPVSMDKAPAFPSLGLTLCSPRRSDNHALYLDT